MTEVILSNGDQSTRLRPSQTTSPLADSRGNHGDVHPDAAEARAVPPEQVIASDMPGLNRGLLVSIPSTTARSNRHHLLVKAGCQGWRETLE